MEEKILSVIIPTYNMEAYLSKCLDSLLVPSIGNLDIIVVNDGSKDRSSEIAHSYAERYPDSIRVIDKTNGNYGSCINAALPTIKGKYVKILDADDTFDSENLEKFINELANQNVDLVLTNFLEIYEDDIKNYRTNIYGPNSYLVNDIPSDRILMHAVCYNSSIFRNLSYFQSEGISYTDTEWCFYPLISVKKIYQYNLPLYKYLIGREGQTISMTGKKINDRFIIIDRMISFYNEKSDVLPDYIKKFMIEKIFIFARSIYLTILIDSYTKEFNKKLRELDNKLQSISLEYYKKLINETTISFAKFKPIKYWKKYNQMPNLILLKIYGKIKRISKFH